MKYECENKVRVSLKTTDETLRRLNKNTFT